MKRIPLYIPCDAGADDVPLEYPVFDEHAAMQHFNQIFPAMQAWTMSQVLNEHAAMQLNTINIAMQLRCSSAQYNQHLRCSCDAAPLNTLNTINIAMPLRCSSAQSSSMLRCSSILIIQRCDAADSHSSTLQCSALSMLRCSLLSPSLRCSLLFIFFFHCCGFLSPYFAPMLRKLCVDAPQHYKQTIYQRA